MKQSPLCILLDRGGQSPCDNGPINICTQNQTFCNNRIFFLKLENLEQRNELLEQSLTGGRKWEGRSSPLAQPPKVLLNPTQASRKGTLISPHRGSQHEDPVFTLVTVEPVISGFVNFCFRLRISKEFIFEVSLSFLIQILRVVSLLHLLRHVRESHGPLKNISTISESLFLP